MKKYIGVLKLLSILFLAALVLFMSGCDEEPTNEYGGGTLAIQNQLDDMQSNYYTQEEVDELINNIMERHLLTNGKVVDYEQRIYELESMLRDFERFEYEDLLEFEEYFYSDWLEDLEEYLNTEFSEYYTTNELDEGFDDVSDVLHSLILSIEELEARIDELENPEELVPIYTQWIDEQLVFTITEEPYSIVLTVDKVFIDLLEIPHLYDTVSVTVCGDICETQYGVERYTDEEIVKELRDWMEELQLWKDFK